MYKLQHLMDMERAQLINIIYNQQIAKLSDHKKTNAGNGKAIPYMGWWWRSIDVINKRATVSTDGDYIGITENNKWGYPQRSLTESEFDKFIELLDAAMAPDYEGYTMADQDNAVVVALNKLQSWMQQLDMSKAYD